MKSILLLSFLKLGLSIPLWGWNQTNTYLLSPFPSPSSTNYITNACGGGYFSQGGLYGFACPHMMMFSEDMILASKYDGLSLHFLYATAGSNNDADCGKCFHVATHHPSHLIIQVINSGGDVGFRQFDLFMGAGGFGVYTACNQDCHQQYCNGGSCHDSLYSGSFRDWTLSSSSSFWGGGNCYGGGIHSYSSLEDLKKKCRNLFKGDEPTYFKNVQLYRSCVSSNLEKYHNNIDAYRSKRVQCPKGLYQLTGLRRQDDVLYPLPIHNETEFEEECRNTNCLTTMCDCCKPSCAWGGKVDVFEKWSAVRTCDKMGFVL